MVAVGDFVIRTIDINGQEVAVQMSTDLAVGDYCILTRDINGRLVAVKPGGSKTQIVDYISVDSPAFTNPYLGENFGAAGYKSGWFVAQDDGEMREVFIKLERQIDDGQTLRLMIGGSGNVDFRQDTDDHTLANGQYRYQMILYPITQAGVDYSAITWGDKPTNGSAVVYGYIQHSISSISGTADAIIKVQTGPWGPAGFTMIETTNSTGSTWYGVRFSANDITSATASFAMTKNIGSIYQLII